MKISIIAKLSVLFLFVTALTACAVQTLSESQSKEAITSGNQTGNQTIITHVGYLDTVNRYVASSDGLYSVCQVQIDSQNLFYVDKESRQETYLCAAPNCAHDSLECTSYLPLDGGYGFGIFFSDGHLYVLQNSVTQSHGPYLMQMEPDGSNRRIVLELQDGENFLGSVFGYGSSLLMEVNAVDETGSWHRRLERIDPQTGEREILLDYPTQKKQVFTLMGAAGTNLIYLRTDYEQRQYFKVDPSCELFPDIQQAKHSLDLHYSKLCNRLNLEWTRCVKETGGMGGVHLSRQQDFYEERIRPMQKKVAVIVSDALRYEVAQELIGELAKSKHIATLKPMLAMLPTETKYGKPALLPHRELILYGNEENQIMSVDEHILNTTEKRSEHLQRYKDGAICVPFETVAEYNQQKNREIFKHPLVYIFHDTIDKAGHDGTAKQVVLACREAIHELATMIPKILASYNVTEVYVTSDHGFLFNDIDFAEKDKHKIEEETIERSTRYYLTRSEAEVTGMVKFPLSEVSGILNGSDVYVAVPQGTNRLAAPSGGYMFTHGGASMQELIIPIIICHQERDDNKQPVGVMMLDRKLSIQASRLRFKLLQTEAVSMDRKERYIRVALYHNDEPVTLVKEFLLDKTDPSLDNRKIQVDLTLNRNVDAKVLQLKVFDAADDLNPLIKENVTNNTLIENDFDFE